MAVTPDVLLKMAAGGRRLNPGLVMDDASPLLIVGDASESDVSW